MTVDLSITDTLGPENQFVTQRFTLFRGYFMLRAIYFDPQEHSVIGKLLLC